MQDWQSRQSGRKALPLYRKCSKIYDHGQTVVAHREFTAGGFGMNHRIMNVPTVVQEKKRKILSLFSHMWKVEQRSQFLSLLWLFYCCVTDSYLSARTPRNSLRFGEWKVKQQRN